MASTNKTTNYELSQYIGTDKPTYLSDYNSDMNKIDLGIHEAQEKANEIGSLNNLTTDSKTNIVSAINEIDSHTDTNSLNINSNTNHIGDLNNLNTSNKVNLVNAINETNNTLNFTTFKRFNPDTDFTYSQNNIQMGGNLLNLATTFSKLYCKLYGILIYTGSSSTPSTNDTILTISNTGLTPDSEFIVNCLGLLIAEDTNVKQIVRVDVTFKTNGDITLSLGKPVSGINYQIILFPCVIQLKSFGDQPE